MEKQVKDKEGNVKAVYVRRHANAYPRDYAKVRGNASPYNGNLLYWSQRLKQHLLMKSERAKLLALQKGSTYDATTTRFEKVMSWKQTISSLLLQAEGMT